MKHGCTAGQTDPATAAAIRSGLTLVNSELLSDSVAPARLGSMNTKHPLQVGQTTVLVTPSAVPLGFALWVDGQLAGLSNDEEKALRAGLKIALAKEADRTIAATEGGTLHGDGETPMPPDCALAFDVGKTVVTIVPSGADWVARVGDDVYHCADREAAIVAGVSAAIRCEIAIVFEGSAQ